MRSGRDHISNLQNKEIEILERKESYVAVMELKDYNDRIILCESADKGVLLDSLADILDIAFIS